MKKTLTKFSLLFLCILCIGTNSSIAQVFYTQDFDGGIGDWTATEIRGNNNASSNWIHTTTGPSGSFAVAALNSTTASNGWMMFDSDLNCSGEQEVRLSSPAIDVNGLSNVFVTMETYYRNFNSVVFLEVSTDGVNWDNSIRLFPEAGNTDYSLEVDGGPANPHNANVDITQFTTGQSTIYIGFRFLADNTTVNAGVDIGCGYAWQIDDVALTSTDPTPVNDLELVRFFIAPNESMPLSQADSIFFGGSITNNGLVDQTNVTLTWDVSRDGASLYSDSFNLGTLAVGGLDTVDYEGLYIPDELGTYTISYTVTSDSVDNNMIDNMASRDFNITENLWAKENGTGLFLLGADGVTRQATLFDMFNSGDYAAEVQFAAGATGGGSLEGQSVTIRIHSTDFGLTPYDDDNLSTEGQTSYTFTADDQANSPSITSVPILNTETGCVGVELLPNKVYSVSVEYDDTAMAMYGSSALNYQLQGESVIALREPDGSYFGGWTSGSIPVIRMVVTDEPTVDLAPESNFSATPAMGLTIDFQDASINGCDLLWDFGDGNSSFSQNPTHTYDADGTYNVCLTVTNDFNADGAVFCQEIMVGTVSTVDLADLNKIEIAPNPVKDILQLNVEMTEVAQTTNIRIVDIAGKILIEESYNNVLEQSFTFDMQGFAAGSYILHMTTEVGTTAQKFTVQK